MTSKHTPGPWVWRGYKTQGIEDVLEPYMCQAEGFIEVSGPNARLIAAAPDMYEALREAVQQHGHALVNLNQARAALDKAEGKT